jgi:transcriptional regulator NrdR family protein
MDCPKCSEKTYVVDSRKSNRHEHRVNKKRVCYDCDTSFYTYELLRDEVDQALAVKKLLTNLIEGGKNV